MSKFDDYEPICCHCMLWEHFKRNKGICLNPNFEKQPENAIVLTKKNYGCMSFDFINKAEEDENF